MSFGLRLGSCGDLERELDDRLNALAREIESVIVGVGFVTRSDRILDVGTTVFTGLAGLGRELDEVRVEFGPRRLDCGFELGLQGEERRHALDATRLLRLTPPLSTTRA